MPIHQNKGLYTVQTRNLILNMHGIRLSHHCIAIWLTGLKSTSLFYFESIKAH